ncbi:MAG TPA: hypothetical protein VMY43_12660 [Methanothrix sp.]|nr:hypothetical protein [Methanothrix sp.]
MDNQILVEKNIIEGKELIEALDKKMLDIKAAMWFYFAESEAWKLLIATPMVDEKGPKEVYRLIQSVIGEMPATSKTSISFEDVIVLSPKDDPIALVGKMIRTGPGLSGIRFTKNVVNNKLIDDAYIYRLYI